MSPAGRTAPLGIWLVAVALAALALAGLLALAHLMEVGFVARPALVLLEVVLTGACAVALVRCSRTPVYAYLGYKAAMLLATAAVPAWVLGAPVSVPLLVLPTLPAVVVAMTLIAYWEHFPPVRDTRPPGAAFEADVPAWFTPSATKLAVMSLVTFGLYEIYWHYRNWQRVSQREGKPMMPFWRGVFGPLWAFFLFRRMAAHAGPVLQQGRPLPSAALAVLYLLLTFTVRLAGPAALLNLASFVPLLLANDVAIRTCRARGRVEIDRRFSGLNWMAVLLGGLLVALTVTAMFVGARPPG